MKYRYFQPTYVKRFRCDGVACGGYCCRAGWSIEIDDDTHEKYAALGVPMNFNDELQKYCIAQGDDGACQCLTLENLCSLQLRHGESILSETCRQFPRQTIAFGNYYERSLSMVCPLVAAAVLTDDPIEFELIDVDETTHRQCTCYETNVPLTLIDSFISIQRMAAFILQRRSLSINARLIMLGFFLDRLDELIELDRIDQLPRITSIYSSEEFYRSQVPLMLKDVGLRDDRRDEALSSILESYLVHEFFINTYPWRFGLSIAHDFAVFVETYRELLRRLMSDVSADMSRERLIETIRDFVKVSDHDIDFIMKQSSALIGRNVFSSLVAISSPL